MKIGASNSNCQLDSRVWPLKVIEELGAVVGARRRGMYTNDPSFPLFILQKI